MQRRPKAPTEPPPESLKRKATSQELKAAVRPKVSAVRPKSPPVQKSATPEQESTSAALAGVAASPEPVRSDSWRDFVDTDPLYALLGELGEKQDVFAEDGILNQEVLDAYVSRLVKPGVVQKTKQWVEVWAKMNIPTESQVPVLITIVQQGLESEIASTIPDVLAELIKNHRCKVKAVEEAITTLFECGEDEQGCISKVLILIFPKSPTSEWGWSRVGWNWQQWWATTERMLMALDTKSAYDVLCEILRSIENDSGAYLPHQQIWDEKRLLLVRTALCKFGGISEEELASSFDVCLQ